jgi:hypothetical protein
MVDIVTSRILEEAVSTIEIPDSSYDKAAQRYRGVAAWFARPEASCFRYSPHVYPQGSFRLGTVVRPINPDDEYDLDLGCRLRTGITKQTHTQKQLKEIVGADLEAYRVAHGIKDPKEEKCRCWRLRYSDTLSFHMDAVPSIPETARQKAAIMDAMAKSATTAALARQVGELTGAITDNRSQNYSAISENWRIRTHLINAGAG